MSVDVIIVNWNGGRELLAAIASARRFGANVIVVDNASESGVATETDVLADATLVRNPRNVGFAAACNVGVASGSADLVFLLNPDAEIITGSVADLERAFESNGAMIVGFPLEHPSGRQLRSTYPLPGTRQLLADLLRLYSRRRLASDRAPVSRPVDGTTQAGWVVGSALAIRRADWEALGGMDEGFFLWYEDVDLGARAARAGGTVAVAAGLLVRHSGASTWSRLPRRRRQRLRVAGTLRYAARHLGSMAAAAILVAAPAALLAGVALDVLHWLTRRP